MNLLKLFGFLLFIHAGYSLIQFRYFLIHHDKIDQYRIPLDILLEIIIAIACNFYFGIYLDKQFENIHQCKPIHSYDHMYSKQNFQDIRNGRGRVLLKYIKEKIGGTFNYKKN